MKTKLGLLILFACHTAVAWTQEGQGGADGGEQSSGDAASVREWIENLDSSRFAERNEAMLQLQRRGVAAIDALSEAALEGSQETADRAFEILKRHHASADESLKEAATKTLAQIAANPKHPKAKASEQVLNPPPPEPVRRGGFMLPNLRVAPGNLRIQVRGGGGIRGLPNQRKVRTTRVKVVDGKKDVTVEEDGEKLRILESADGIRVERTDKKGKLQTEKYKNLDELKKQDANAHQEFENAGGPGMRMNLRIGAPRNQPRGDDLRKKLEEARKRMEDTRREAEQRRENLRKELEPLRRKLDPDQGQEKSKAESGTDPFELIEA